MRVGLLHILIFLSLQNAAWSRKARGQSHSHHQPPAHHHHHVRSLAVGKNATLLEEQICNEHVRPECNPFIHYALIGRQIFLKSKVSSVMEHDLTVATRQAETFLLTVTNYLVAAKIPKEEIDAMIQASAFKDGVDVFIAEHKVIKAAKEVVYATPVRINDRADAISACLATMIEGPKTALDLGALATDPDRAFVDSLYTFGDARKFDSWGFTAAAPTKADLAKRQNVFRRQVAFVQGRETLHTARSMLAIFRSALKQEPTPTQWEQFISFGGGLASNQMDNVELSRTYRASTAMQRSSVVEGVQRSDEEAVRKAAYQLAAAIRLYPALIDMLLNFFAAPVRLPPEISVADVTNSRSNYFSFLVDQLKRPSSDVFGVSSSSTARGEFATDLWDLFVAGAKFGVNNGGYDSLCGWGVYMALHPDDAHEHGSECLKCPIDDSVNVINIDPAMRPCNVRNLVVANLMKRRYTESDDRLELRLIAFNSKNLWTSPYLAEKILGSLKTLVVFRPEKNKMTASTAVNPYVADKGAVDWSRCVPCPEKASTIGVT